MSMHIGQVVLAGGGNRCWWQIGFWHRLNEITPISTNRIYAISAGSATACLLFTRPGREGAEHALGYYRQTLEGVNRNVYWENLFSKESIFPHHSIYRGALMHMLVPGFEHLKSAPEIHIGLAITPPYLNAHFAVLTGLLAYNLEKHLFKSLHPRFGRALGFTRRFVRAQDCKTPDDLAELILQSSCTPPFTPAMVRDGQAVLDGGLVDNVPIDGLTFDEKLVGNNKVIVLLTRRYPLPDIFIRKIKNLNVLYIQPKTKVPISSWDYANYHLMPITYQQGLNDAEKSLKDPIFMDFLREDTGLV